MAEEDTTPKPDGPPPVSAEEAIEQAVEVDLKVGTLKPLISNRTAKPTEVEENMPDHADSFEDDKAGDF